MLCNTSAVSRSRLPRHATTRILVLTVSLAVALMRNVPVIAQVETSPDPAMAGMVAQELAQLGVKPKTTVLPSDRSFEAITAIKRGDYATGRRIAEDVLASSKLQNWRFYPFNEFMGAIGRGGNDPLLLSRLNLWLAREPQSAIAHLIRGRYYRQAGWEARAEDIASSVPKPKMDEFASDMALAKTDIQAAIKLNPRNPWSYYEMMDILLGQGNTPEMQAAFQAGI
jgi:hypothetical protein